MTTIIAAGPCEDAFWLKTRIGRSLAKLRFMIALFFAISPTYSAPRFNSARDENLAEVDSSEIGNRTPLILIHGISSTPSVWHNFLAYYASEPMLSNNFKPYVFSYFTEQKKMDQADPQTLAGLGIALGNYLNQWYAGGSSVRFPFNRKRAILIGHSMGGLVARSMMDTFHFPDAPNASDKIALLITLATPHHGTPVANEYYYTPESAKWAGSFLFDLHPQLALNLSWDCYENKIYPGPPLAGFCGSLVPSARSTSKIVAYGGISDSFLGLWRSLLYPTYTLIGDAGYANDGAVPIYSALFQNFLPADRARIVDGDCNHYQIVEGHQTYRGIPLFDAIAKDLLDAVSATNARMDVPAVATEHVSPSDVGNSTAVIRGKVLSDGGSPVTEWRLEFGQSEVPDGTWTVLGGNSITTTGDRFGANVSGLPAGRTFHYRASARNASPSVGGCQSSPGWGCGEIASFTTLTASQVSAPIISPPGGAFHDPIQITLASATSSATVRFTLDGSDPDETSPIFSGPTGLTTAAILKARAFRTGYSPSAVSVAYYSFAPSQGTAVATPSISPNGGTYQNSVDIKLSCATAGATIVFTTDGSEPNLGSTVYSEVLTLSGSDIVKVKAFVPGVPESATVSAAFTITTASTGNDSFGNRVVLTGRSGQTAGSTIGATYETGRNGPKEPLVNGATPFSSVWWTWTAPETGPVQFKIDSQTGGFAGYLLLGVYSGSSLANLIELAGGELFTGDQYVAINANAGVTYQVQVGQKVNGTAGNFKLSWETLQAPQIHLPPQDIVIAVGGTATFGVSASGTVPFGYQWQFNGKDIPGERQSSLMLTNVQITAEGEYSVVVENSVGRAQSQPAVLHVKPSLDGFLNVDIAPFDLAGRSKWRLDSKDWIPGKIGSASIPAGSHIVSFLAIPGWRTVADKAITIGQGETLTLSVRYHRTMDFLGSGGNDVLLFNPETRQPALLQAAAGNHVKQTLPAGGSGWAVIGSGDFNGDGLADLLWRNSSSGELGTWFVSSGHPIWQWIGDADLEWDVLGTIDVNSDGISDILWRHRSTGFLGLWQSNRGRYEWLGIGGSSTDWEVVAFADLDSNGVEDLIWRNPKTGEVGVWLLFKGGGAQWARIGTSSSEWRIVGKGDFDGDGASDLLWQNSATGEVGAWLMAGTAVRSWLSIGSSALPWRVRTTADLNGDFATDIVWQNDTSGVVGTWLMQGSRPNWLQLSDSEPQLKTVSQR